MPTPLTPRVLMIVHDPLVATNQRLHQYYRWNDPRQLAQQYIDDLVQASHGLLTYRVVQIIDAPWFPVKIDGFQYTVADYLNRWARRDMHQPDGLDYPARMAAFDLYARFNRQEFDEVWVFSPPYAGEYESIMIGPRAIWCNAPPLHTTAIAHNLVMMGFNYERDVGCMLENFGHRVESIMQHVYAHSAPSHNLWTQFCQYEQRHPNAAACGNVHFAPNSSHDYDWGNRRAVWSSCDRWRDYPHTVDAPTRIVDCHEWGNGDMRAHHIWWLQHLPRYQGMLDGIWGNWWEYVVRGHDVALP